MLRLILLHALMLPAGLAQAGPLGVWPPQCQTGSLPSGDPRYPADQLILTCLPERWNGQLVIYAHGYTPAQAPLALPEDDLAIPGGPTVPDILLPLGFAFATSSYHKNGYAVEQAANDLNALVEHFKTEVAPGPVRQVLITCASEGGLITAMLIERHPDIYHGGLALCGPLGGAPSRVQYLGDFRVVFDYFFPHVFPFGAADVPADAYLDWDTVYAPAIASAVRADPAATDQLFDVTRAPRNPADPESAVTTATNALFYSIWGTTDAIEVAGGQPYDNRFRLDRRSDDDAALNQGGERVPGDEAARAYMRQFYQPTGRLSRPLVTLHTLLDEQVPFRHELIYRARAQRAGRGGFLTTLSVPRYGHCAFTAPEILRAFALLLLQVQGRVDPGLGAYLSSPPARRGSAGEWRKEAHDIAVAEPVPELGVLAVDQRHSGPGGRDAEMGRRIGHRAPFRQVERDGASVAGGGGQIGGEGGEELEVNPHLRLTRRPAPAGRRASDTRRRSPG